MIIVTADCRRVSGAEFFRAVFPKPENAHVAGVRSYLRQGKVEEARKYLEAINRLNRAFDIPEIELPGDLDLTEVAGDPLQRDAGR